MAIVQAVLALISRSLGRIASAIFGWAVVALFGQTSGREKTALSALVGAAALWPLLLLGIAVPKIAVFALSFVPLPEWVPKWAVRAVWIVLAAAVPFAVGITMAIRQRRPARTPLGHVERQSSERESAVVRLLRGFPITIGIAGAFFVVFVTVPVLRVISLIRRRIDVQVPLVTDAASYDDVARKVAQTLAAHGFEVVQAPPGWWLTVPSRILLGFGGSAFRDFIPQHLAYFRGPRLEVALYPNALLVRGSEQDTAWAHGVVVEALTDAPALQTFDPGAQDIERQIRRVWSVYRENPAAHVRSAALSGRLAEIARDIAELPVPYDEWQIVYRQALQLGRALDGDRQLLESLSKREASAAMVEAEEARMATLGNGESARHLSNSDLIREIAGKASVLLKKEVELAKAEIRADLQAEIGMVKTLAIAGVAALLGLDAAVVALILGLASVIPGWAAALIVAGGLLGIAAVVGFVGWRRHVTRPLTLTRQTLKEDLQWMKERAA
jgi:hypothetical protein